jgi:uncharacterized membrane protein HdeD (DUF308 family)
MKLLVFISSFLIVVGLCGGAFWLCLQQKSDWGWFLFVGLISICFFGQISERLTK